MQESSPPTTGCRLRRFVNYRPVINHEGFPTLTYVGEIGKLIDHYQEEGHDNEDAVSIAESRASSTESLNSHIARYRQIHGRTYHSEIGNATYW